MSKETLSQGAWWLALGTALLVGILSWQTGLSFLWSIIRVILAFVLIYALSTGSLYWFDKTAPERMPEETEKSTGAFIDIAVGQETDDQATMKPGYGGSTVAGQVNFDLPQGLPDAEKQAEIVRRMGWGE